jgi:hypothetical protein
MKTSGARRFPRLRTLIQNSLAVIKSERQAPTLDRVGDENRVMKRNSDNPVDRSTLRESIENM